MDRKSFRVTGMSCGGCESNVENSLTTLSGVSRVEADHETETVEVVADDDVSTDDITAAIEDAGYDVEA
ncbi:heavy metal transporter [Halobacteriales archaeon QH_2_65_14]|nr:MAG: heavy metal transporter [Halobacteriales archaeon QH_2_65_14]